MKHRFFLSAYHNGTFTIDVIGKLKSDDEHNYWDWYNELQADGFPMNDIGFWDTECGVWDAVWGERTRIRTIECESMDALERTMRE